MPAAVRWTRLHFVAAHEACAAPWLLLAVCACSSAAIPRHTKPRRCASSIPGSGWRLGSGRTGALDTGHEGSPNELHGEMRRAA